MVAARRRQQRQQGGGILNPVQHLERAAFDQDRGRPEVALDVAQRIIHHHHRIDQLDGLGRLARDERLLGLADFRRLRNIELFDIRNRIALLPGVARHLDGRQQGIPFAAQIFRRRGLAIFQNQDLAATG